MSESADELRRQLSEAQAEIAHLNIDRELERQAEAMGFTIPPAHAAKLADRSGIGFDPSSRKVIGAKDALAKLLEKYPDLAEPSGPRPGPGSAPRPKPRRPTEPDPYDLELRALGKGGRM